jgi:hypothetical protein
MDLAWVREKSAILYKKVSMVLLCEAFAMGHSGFAIVMTSLTTAAGMWSFAFSDVAPVADLGIFASASIALGFIV